MPTASMQSLHDTFSKHTNLQPLEMRKAKFRLCVKAKKRTPEGKAQWLLHLYLCLQGKCWVLQLLQCYLLHCCGSFAGTLAFWLVDWRLTYHASA